MIQLRRSRWRRMAAAAAVALFLLLALASCSGSARPTAADQPARPSPAVNSTATPRPAPATPARNTPARIDGLAVIYVDELPREARETLRLIERGGPFPYSKDGALFQNREGILPKRSRDYYQEYTVITPGENDRGARRIVAGSQGERYYTADHYDSFARIIEQ